MKPSPSEIFITLLISQPPEKQKLFLSFLPVEDQQALQEIPPISDNPLDFLLPHSSLLSWVHYSWFLSYLSSYSKEDISLFLPCFDTELRSSLDNLLGSSTHPQLQLLPQGKEFLSHCLLEDLLKNEVLLPITHLPESPLNALLLLTKAQLLSLIDYLSLFDLALELHRIVETKTLQKVQEFLPENKLKFLRTKTNYKEPFAFPPLDLEKWEGDEAAFSKLLHKRGLFRLSRGVSVQHPDFIWYFCHRLDTGRGHILQAFCDDPAKPQVAEIVIKNILELISLMAITKGAETV